VNNTLHKLKLENLLWLLYQQLRELPKPLLDANVALNSSRHILQFSIEQFQKELENAYNALSATTDS
jgi:hypothetical protein